MVIRAQQGHRVLDINGFNLRHIQRIRGNAAVGANESACSEFDAAKIARHDDRDICHVAALDSLQDRFSGCTGWLAVIIKARYLIRAKTDTIGKTIVCGVKMLL